MRRGALTLALVAGLGGCRSNGAPSPAPSSSAAPSASAPSSPDSRETALAAAEARRDAASVTAADLAARAVRVRRLAARALARTADPRSAALLRGALGDEDPDVVAWAAFGLGRLCSREPSAPRALVMRAVSLADTGQLTQLPGALDPVLAIAGALARCGGGEAERTLAAWLAEPGTLAESGALGLGLLAARAGHLDDPSLVALLDAAAREDGPAHALFPFSRLPKFTPPIERRLAETAARSLERSGIAVDFAARALGAAGASAAARLATGERDPETLSLARAAAERLGALVADRARAASLRASAARELPKLGAPGQDALARALVALAPPPGDDAALTTGAWAPLRAVLDGFESPAPGAARAALAALASRPLPEGASAPLRRRLVALRCGAAALLAGSATLSRELVACDPEPNGRAGALATVRVLGRAPITRARHRRWLGYAASADSVVREAALGLMPSHPEIEAPAAVLAEALGASAGGVVATAAQLIAAYPSRAAAPDAGRAAPPREPSDAGAEAPRALEVAPEVVQALTRAFDAERPPDAVEVRAALADAAASLGLLSFKPRILALCTSPNDYLRLHAEKALRLLGERERACPRPRPAPSAPPVPSAPPPGAVELVLETDAGSLVLSLDGRLAPLAATRLRELARAGFFDGVVAHRVVPGFVAQFGDPGGDGYGGAGEAPLPSELSPLAFTERAVGVALSAPGTDTGSSQLFVTLGPYPQLDGDYPLIGHASGDWDALASGDVIAKVTVR